MSDYESLTGSSGEGEVDLDSDLDAIAEVSGTGHLTRTADNTWDLRSVAVGSNKLTITNPAGVAGDPTLDVAEANLTISNMGGTLAITHGGTGQTGATAAFDALAPTTTKGDIIVNNGSDNIRLAAGTDDYVLVSDSSTASGLKWAEVEAGDSSPTTTKGDLIVYDGTAEADVRLPVGTNGYVLTADSGETAGVKWAEATGGTDTHPVRELWWGAEALQPLETAFAPLEQLTGTLTKTYVRAFDDTAEEYVNGKFLVPGSIDTSGTVTFRAYVMAKTAAASKNIALTFGHIAVNDSEDFDPASYTEEDSGNKAIDATQDDVTEVTWTETVSNLGWAANDLVFFRLSRDPGAGNDLSGDMYLFSFSVEIPRAV